jgi:DNA-binding cell septation regulator SpoVG
MNIDEINVDLRLLSKTDSKARAFADVTVPAGMDGFIKLSGFVVFQGGKGDVPRVGLPTRKVQERYVESVVLIGKVRGLIEEAVLSEYGRATKGNRS